MRDAEEARTVRLSIPAQPEFITLSRLALAGLSRVRALPAETLADLKLAITEACSNSVRHAYAGGDGTVEIVYRLEPDRIEIEVSDDGTGFDHSGAGAFREEDELSEGGLGIAIIRSIADDLEIAHRRGRPRVAAPVRRRTSSRSETARIDSVPGVAARRRLIVVSNRGPVGYSRDAGGRACRATRRRRARDRTARARRPPRRDVDRERDLRGGSRRRRGGRRSRRRCAVTRPCACGSSRTTSTPTTGTTTSSPTRRSGSSSTTSGT